MVGNLLADVVALVEYLAANAHEIVTVSVIRGKNLLYQLLEYMLGGFSHEPNDGVDRGARISVKSQVRSMDRHYLC